MLNKNKILLLDKVMLKVPGRDLPIIKHADFCVEKGDFIILLGSNGSGKSSLLKLINKTYLPSRGNIKLSGKDLTKYNHRELARLQATFTQNMRDNLFMDMTIAENAILFQAKYQSPPFYKKTRETRQELKDYLAQFSPKIASRLNTSVSLLSGGEQQILILALNLRYQPELILLDEHTSALDPKTSVLMMEKTYQAITERNITCLMATHNLDFATEYGNRLIVIKEGEVTQDLSGNEKKQITRKQLLDLCY